MFATNPKFVIDENNNPVAVLLDYRDWQKIEPMLGILQDIPEAHKIEAENKAKEIYVMELLRYGDISTGRAAELLNILRVELLDRMGKYDISVFPDYTAEELEREVNETAQMLEQYKTRS